MFKKIRKYFTKAAAVKISLTIPAFAGFTLLSLGVAFINLPAGIIVGGACLIWLDSRL